MTIQSKFPDFINICFRAFGSQFNTTFSKSLKSEAETAYSDDIYVIDQVTKNPVKFNPENEEAFETYREVTGTGIATLIRNNDEKANSSFRCVRKFRSIFIEVNIHEYFSPLSL